MEMRHGILLAKSIPSKKYSIKTGESIMEARQKCPDLMIVPPNYSLYEQSSRAFMDILRQYSPDVQVYNVDEAFVDMAGTEGLWGNPTEAADRIRIHIREELGFTVNIGISSNKLLAKMASDFKKPDRTHTLFPEEIQRKMWLLLPRRSMKRHAGFLMSCGTVNRSGIWECIPEGSKTGIVTGRLICLIPRIMSGWKSWMKQ